MSPIILGVSAVLEVRRQCSVVYILLFIGTSYCWLPNNNQTFLTDPNFDQPPLFQSSPCDSEGAVFIPSSKDGF